MVRVDSWTQFTDDRNYLAIAMATQVTSGGRNGYQDQYVVSREERKNVFMRCLTFMGLT